MATPAVGQEKMDTESLQDTLGWLRYSRWYVSVTTLLLILLSWMPILISQTSKVEMDIYSTMQPYLGQAIFLGLPLLFAVTSLESCVTKLHDRLERLQNALDEGQAIRRENQEAGKSSENV